MIGEAVPRAPVASPPVAAAEVLGWLVLVATGGLWLTFLVGTSSVWPVVVAQSALPILLLASWPVLAFAAAHRRWALAAVSLVVVAGSVSVIVPVVSGSTEPAWAATAPTLRVLEANVYYDNDRRAAAVQTLIDADADVIVLAEVTGAWVDALRAGGLLDRYPHQLLHPVDHGGRGEALLSRLPIEGGTIDRLGTHRVPSATVAVDGRAVRILGVHAQSPSNPFEVPRWTSDLDLAAEARAERGDGRMVLVGDFNASYWHAPFRRMLTDGWRDAHQSLGLGLHASWPNVGALGAVVGPYTRLDHAVLSPGVVATRVDDIDIPGSDHRGFVATLALGP